MKKHIFFTFSLIISLHSFLYSQNCLPDGISFSTQAEIDSFPANYPGCTEIGGDLRIEGADISNLDSLYPITSIEQELFINRCDILSDISGIGNLQNVIDITIYGNPILTNLNGLDGIVAISGSLSIYGNDNISDISALRNISEIGVSLRISDTKGIQNLNDIENIKKIGGALSIHDNIDLINLSGIENIDSLSSILIEGNPSLKNIDALSNLKYLDVDAYIYYNDSLVNIHLNDLVNLRDLIINHNNQLTSISVNNLQNTIRKIKIEKNDILQEVSGFNLVDTIESIYITENTSLKQINGFNNIKCIDYYLEIKKNDSLESIDAFNSTKIINKILINHNELLESINGFSDLDTIRDALTITSNKELSELNAFHKLKSIGNELYIYEGKIRSFSTFSELSDVFDIKLNKIMVLKDFSGFESIRTIKGNLTIGYNSSLTSFNGFNNLQKIIGDFSLNKNNSLLSLNGLNNLTEIQGDLYFRANDLLPNLSGLDNLETVNDAEFISTKLLSFNGLTKLHKVRYLTLNSCNEIRNLNGLNAFDTIVILTIKNSHKLLSLEGLSRLSYVGNINIEHNNSLISLQGLTKLKVIESYFTFKYNPLIENFNGLDSIQKIKGGVVITNNNALQNFNGLQKLTYIGRDFKITDNKYLINFSGLSQLSEINGNLIVINNKHLKSFDGMNSISLLNRGLEIENNKDLENLYQFINITTIDEMLKINNNDALSSLVGLDNITLGYYNTVSIFNNESLSICDVESFCAALQDSSPSNISIYNNAEGCNSKQEVIDACGNYSETVFPDLRDQPTWNVLETKSTYPGYSHTQVYSYEKDTIFCGNKYSIIHIGNSKAYIHNKQEKTYILKEAGCDKKEYLLYDYTINIGDTVWLGLFTANQTSIDTIAYVLKKENIYNQFGLNMRQLVLESSQKELSPFPTLNWIEGVGAEEHPFYPLAYSDKSEEDYSYELLCFRKDESLVYQNTKWNDCDINTTGIINIEESEITIAPNPFHNQLKISSIKQIINQIKVLDITGSIVLQVYSFDSKEIILYMNESLPTGMYLFQIFTNDEMIQQKVLKL